MASTASSADSNGVLSSLIGRAPQYKDGHDAVMFALHTHLLRRSLVCHALTPPPASQQPQQQRTELPFVPPGWNSCEDSYSFTYHRPAVPNVVVVLKGVKMANSLILHAIRQRGNSGSGGGGAQTTQPSKDEAPVSLEVNVPDYINTAAPLTDYRSLYTDLGGLLLLFDSQVAARVMPAPPTQSAPSMASVDTSDPLRVGPVRPPLAGQTTTRTATTGCAILASVLEAATSMTTSTRWEDCTAADWAAAVSWDRASSRMAARVASAQSDPTARLALHRASTRTARCRAWASRTSTSSCRPACRCPEGTEDREARSEAHNPLAEERGGVWRRWLRRRRRLRQAHSCERCRIAAYD